MGKLYKETFLIDGIKRTITGREAWALGELLDAGPKGCTSKDNPAPRLSAYIHDLRHDHGVKIDTLPERHEGKFAGNHGRYILRSKVSRLDAEGLAA